MLELPVYIQIHNKIKDQIAEGIYELGSRVPSERDLAVKFQVSRMTLRQAIQTLVDEGILERRIGSGTYVASQKVQEKMSGVTSFTDIMIAQGRTPSSKTISYHVADPSASEIEKLKMKSGERVLRMERIRFADDLPISFEEASIPQKLVKGFKKKEVTDSLYHTLETKAHRVLGGAQQTVSASLASERIAEMLNIKRADAILKLRQVSYLQSGEPFEYVRTQYVGNRFEFFLEK